MSTKPGYQPIPEGDPRTGIGTGADNSAYFRSLIPPAPRDPVTDLNDLSDCKRIFFNPDYDTSQQILLDLYDPRTSVADLALRHHTTVEAICLWLAHPDIAARIAALNSASAQRIRMVANSRLLHAVEALDNILTEYNDGACHKAAIAEGRASSMDNHLRRDRETARKAAALLYRITKFDGSGPPSLREGAGGRARIAHAHPASLSESAHPTSHISHPTSVQITLGPPDWLTATTIQLPPIAPSEPSTVPRAVAAPPRQPAPTTPDSPARPDPASHAEGVLEAHNPRTDPRSSSPAHASSRKAAPGMRPRVERCEPSEHRATLGSSATTTSANTPVPPSPERAQERTHLTAPNTSSTNLAPGRHLAATSAPPNPSRSSSGSRLPTARAPSRAPP